jgi:hypothetical protein
MVPVIIIPVLNRYDLMERAIRSIDYPVERLIIIDNGDGYDPDMLAWTTPWQQRPHQSTRTTNQASHQST